jgi:hypothetical protein
MLVPTLLLLLVITGIGLGHRLARRKPAEKPVPAHSEYLPAPHQFDMTPQMPRTLEVAHASRSGALALKQGRSPRVRPGHRCVEEVRRRCHFDFVGAMNFLEGQLNRRVSDNAHEQARYWIDLAEGLRGLNLHESLPALLRRADDALDLPLADGYAAEVSTFAAFAEYLHDPLTQEGQSALRILRVAMEGVRSGRVPAGVYADAAFGDAVRRLSENCPNEVNPRLVLAFIEALRHGRRSFHTWAAFRDDPVRRQTVRWQHAFLKDAEPILREYLHDIDADLTRLLEQTQGRGRCEILRALSELQADTDDIALTLLGDPAFDERCDAIRCLRWSKSPLAPTALCGIARHALTGERSARWLRRLGVGRKPVPAEEIREAIRALRGHPSDEAERVLLHYAGRPEAAWREAAFQSLGWWEPARRGEVLHAIRSGRQDADANVRRASLAAGARLGECAALQMIRDTMARESQSCVLDAIRLCASEGLSWLWPELDLLTESDDPAIAAEAWEAIERLREEFLGPLG